MKKAIAPRPVTAAKATERARKRELQMLRRDRKAIAAIALREITSLGKQAAKIAGHHKQQDSVLARRVAIVQSRLS